MLLLGHSLAAAPYFWVRDGSVELLRSVRFKESHSESTLFSYDHLRLFPGSEAELVFPDTARLLLLHEASIVLLPNERPTISLAQGTATVSGDARVWLEHAWVWVQNATVNILQEEKGYTIEVIEGKALLHDASGREEVLTPDTPVRMMLFSEGMIIIDPWTGLPSEEDISLVGQKYFREQATLRESLDKWMGEDVRKSKSALRGIQQQVPFSLLREGTTVLQEVVVGFHHHLWYFSQDAVNELFSLQEGLLTLGHMLFMLSFAEAEIAKTDIIHN